MKISALDCALTVLGLDWKATKENKQTNKICQVSFPVVNAVSVNKNSTEAKEGKEAITHFRVAACLSFKASPGAQSFKRK